MKEPMTIEELKGLRKSINMSQSEFASLLGVSIQSVRNWEQRRPQKIPEYAANLIRLTVKAYIK